MKGHAFFQGMIITKKQLYVNENQILKSSPEPLCQFQPNLAQSIHDWIWLYFVHMNDHALFQGEVLTKLGTIHLSVKRIQVFMNKGPLNS